MTRTEISRTHVILTTRRIGTLSRVRSGRSGATILGARVTELRDRRRTVLTRVTKLRTRLSTRRLNLRGRTIKRRGKRVAA